MTRRRHELRPQEVRRQEVRRQEVRRQAYSYSTDSSDDESYISDGSSYDGSAVYYDDASDFKEEDNNKNGVLRNVVRTMLCIVPNDVKKELKKVQSYDSFYDDDEESEYHDETKISTSQNGGAKDSKEKGIKNQESAEDEDEIIDAITNRLPQCRDTSNVEVSTELHIMITQQKWKRVTKALELLTDTSSNPHHSSSKMERKYKSKLELYIRQVDENGRSPLSLACGVSSAPPNVIRLLLKAFPHAASMEDKNDNLPIHHFCHSYRRSNNTLMSLMDSRDADDDIHGRDSQDEDVCEELEVLEMLYKVWPEGVKSLNTYGNLPLHVHIEHQCANNLSKQTLRVALRLLELNPAAAMAKNRGGSLPLHYVGKASLKSQIVPLTSAETKKQIHSLIKSLHRAYPDAIKVKNHLGSTPFFVSVIYNANIEVWNELLLRYPQAATNDNDRNITPISAYWNMFVSAKAKARYLNLSPDQANEEGKIIKKNRKEMSSIKSRNHFEQTASSRLQDFWAKMELMLKSSALGSPVLTSKTKETWQPLHAILKVDECPSDVLKFALQMYRHETEEVDAKGDLPLHLATRIPQRYNVKQDENTKAMITRLIDVYPGATNHFNMEGRVPLHIAILSGRTWSIGVQELVAADRASLSISDPKTGLFPFMLAAIGNESVAAPRNAEEKKSAQIASLATIFELLRASPQLVNVSLARESVGKTKEKKLREKNMELLRSKAKIQKEKFNMEANTNKLKQDVASKDKKIEELERQLKKMQLESSTKRMTIPKKRSGWSKKAKGGGGSVGSSMESSSRLTKRSNRSSHIVRRRVE